MDILIAFDSKTGNVRRFVNKLGMRTVQIEAEMIINEPFILVTYTTGIGKVPQKVIEFLKVNHSNMIGVAASGNKNWGQAYCKSAETIAENYNVPVVSRFEMSGTNKDVELFKEVINKIGKGDKN